MDVNMTRDDVTLEIREPDWDYHVPGEKLIDLYIKRDAKKLIRAIYDEEHGKVFDTYYAELDSSVVSASIRGENVNFTLYDLGDGTCRLSLFVIPTPEGDDILDGSFHPMDLNLTDMMSVVATVKTFMKLLEN